MDGADDGCVARAQARYTAADELLAQVMVMREQAWNALQAAKHGVVTGQPVLVKFGGIKRRGTVLAFPIDGYASVTIPVIKNGEATVTRTYAIDDVAPVKAGAA